MPKDALTVLREARELISDPKRWTQGAFAEDEHGEPRLGSDASAVCWCAEGALQYVCRNMAPGEFYEARKRLNEPCRAKFAGAIWYVNDYVDHATVLRMFDAAIASAEAEDAR